MAKKIEIRVTKEIRMDLVKEFEACDKTIWNALKFETDSPAAKMIRKRALELGGQEWYSDNNDTERRNDEGTTEE